MRDPSSLRGVDMGPVAAAFDLGFACRVASDACATRDLEFEGRSLASADVHAAFMSALAAPYATVASSRDLISG